MGQVINRHLGTVATVEPGQYCKTSDGLAIVSCPSCGGVDIIAEDHAIDPAGRVVPCWSCPTENCPMLDWIFLESWLA